ncbi:hypothetical protein GIB67_042543 [Kingdonia uniflora]|uniref:SAC domain-containing protein n=1 Tax=Kingdonia uniflora TaxID=39325 RepID=A0A7J7M1A4_9MAGN|nr:hypothetical protein GIB67_042543 [Kingdonia uniflora]
MDDFKNENRYKMLLSRVDLTKDFFFRYSYHVMRSLQKNIYDGKTGGVPYEIMFIWNEFLTRGIRNHLRNTFWKVTLVYGFFKQAKLTVSGRDFRFILTAGRLRHYAGTRYLKKCVNGKGRVANNVEIEQIVSEDVVEGCPAKNLAKRYGSPIIILNLIKTHERKLRESMLRAEFANVIKFINKDLSDDSRPRFLHWDLHKHSRSKATNVLALLDGVAEYALNLAGFFYCQVTPELITQESLNCPHLESIEDGDWFRHCDNKVEYVSNSEKVHGEDIGVAGENHPMKLSMLQKGVLRTNCIDCLDLTNMAQYTYGLAALGHQLHALGFIDIPKFDLDAPLTYDLMQFYKKMGDTLAFQYGGSAAHNKIFTEIRGQWKATTQSQEFFQTLQRYYSNTYMNAEKRDAINVFLGYFQLQQGKPEL